MEVLTNLNNTPLKMKRVTNKDGTRYYEVDSGRKYPSVTTVISKEVFNFRKLNQWKETVGLEEANKVTRQASGLGTKVHKLNELYFSKEAPKKEPEPEVISRHNLYLPFLDNVKPLYIEQEIYWETICQDQYMGFAGTPDLVGVFEKPELLGLERDSPVVFLADYKNWKNSKTPDRLLTTFIQLAAYTGAVNSQRQTKIQDAFILGTTKRKLHIYHLGLRELNWYWVWFIEALKKYYGFESSFQRNKFEEYSVGYILEGKDEEGKNIWGQREENYLAKKLTLNLNQEAEVDEEDS